MSIIFYVDKVNMSNSLGCADAQETLHDIEGNDVLLKQMHLPVFIAYQHRPILGQLQPV